MADEFDPLAVSGGRTDGERKPRQRVGAEPTSNEATKRLCAFVERVELLEEEKKAIGDDIKSVYGEAKAMGFDTKIMKRVIALRKIDDGQRAEEDLILDAYLAALGMLPDYDLAHGD